MYRDDEFYFLTDKLHHDVYRIALNNHIEKEERVIVKIFRLNDEEIVIETVNGTNNIIKDTRKDKSSDILNYNLVFLKSLERYVSSYEIKNMYYEYVDGICAWCRVKIDGFNPNDKDLDIFYKKKKVTEELIKNSNVSNTIKSKQLKFLKIVKDFKFTDPKKVSEIFKI